MHSSTMMRRVLTAAITAGSLLALVGCAQQVGDIDRTNPNKLTKTDFDGTWYLRQTISDVPSTHPFFFTGLSTGLEKLNFEITANSLIGYKAYELVPGSDPSADTQGINDTVVIDETGDGIIDGEGHNPESYKGSPVVAYSISSHFDVQRSYSSSTGEQSNVIVENSSDRYWNEREFFRVNWSANQLSNIELLDTENIIQYKHWYGEEDPLAQTFKQEFDENDKMVYFEFTTKAIIVPTIACYLFSYAGADCAPTEIEIVNSFARVPEVETYEAVEYDNVDMFKFGYFRTERLTYDRKRGIRRSGQIFLPNRHNIWETAYNADGTRIPLTERTPQPVVYYINKEMPSELWPYNVGMADEWDRAFTRAAAAGKKMTPEAFTAEHGRMFVLCHNPVQVNDDASCGEAGFEVNIGDVRFNHVHWVHQPQLSGPLGYGPSGADPETGEIITGTAYVYGASVDRYAASSLDVINLILTCEEFGEESAQCQAHVDEITAGSDIRADILGRLTNVDPRAEVSPELKNIPVPTDMSEMLSAEMLSKIEFNAEEPRPWDAGFEERQLNRMKDNGFDLGLLDPEMIKALTGTRHNSLSDLPEEEIDRIRPANWMTASRIHKLEEARTEHFAKHNIMHESFVDDVVAGLAVQLAEEAKTLDPAGRDEYMYQKVRGLIYKGVMEHEVGHTIGLRHNFSGSYDSLNYFDNYWKLRKENLRDIEFVNDLYEVAALTDNQRLGRVVDANGNVVEQLQGGLPEYGYSSIMDYGLRFNTDVHGIGKYDEAAIIYAYTEGFDGRLNEQGEELVDSGYVEAWTDAAFAEAQTDDDGTVIAADILRQLDFRESLVYTHILEGFNYKTVANWWGNVENIKLRQLQKFDDVRAARDAGDPNRPVEVPFMFCTDDWVGVDSSCHRWDHGADPMEQTNYIINSYRDYYWFNNFARDSYSWSPYSKVGRTFSRYFSYLTNIYQQLFFGGDFGGIQSTYRWMAANAGLNLVAEVMTTPNYGDHVVDGNGMLVHCFDSTNDEFEEGGVTTSTSEKCSDDNIDAVIPMGQGRYPFNRYDFNSGYSYYRYPTEAGHFYDYLAAVLAMTSTRATVRGVDIDTDTLAYSLPYYIIFNNQLNNLFGSIWLETPGDFGPVLVDGEVVARPLSPISFGDLRVDPHSGRAVNSNNIPQGMEAGRIMQPYHSWSMRLYPLLYGMAFFSSNLNLEFADNNNIFRLGNGEAFDPGPGFELLTCTDPLLGHTYGAVRNLGSANLSTAVTLIERCAQDSENFLSARNGLRFDEAADYQRDVERTVGYINLMRGYYDIFGSL